MKNPNAWSIRGIVGFGNLLTFAQKPEYYKPQKVVTMKKNLLMFAASLICGASVFTSCTSNNETQPKKSPQQVRPTLWSMARFSLPKTTRW